MSHRRPDADELWRQLVSLVMDTRDDWRRRVGEATGLPFGRVRALRRLVDGPRTLSDLAEAISSDAPATSVLVTDLEAKGLVVRAPHPTNGRAKLVSLTPAGHKVVERERAVTEHAPAAFTNIAPEDLAALARVVEAMSQANANPTPPRGRHAARR